MLSRALMLLLLMTTALGTQAMAQSQPIALGEIVVEADGAGLNATSVRSTAGSKLAVAVTQVPQSISVISRKQLDSSPGPKADAALRYSAGVSTQTYGTDADTDWFYVRGFQAEQTGMFLDNLSLYQYSFGTFLVDPYLLESIEVLKGPASVLYGGATVGGIVNYVSKRPTGERFLTTETGINNLGNAYLGIDGGDVLADGDVSYRLTGKLSGGGWETKNARDLRGVVQGSVTYTPSDATSITLYGTYQNVDLDHTSTGFLPFIGTAVDAPGGVRIPRDLNYGEPAIDLYQRQQYTVGYEIEQELDGNWTVRQNARYAAVDVNEDNIYSSGFNALAGNQLVRDRWAHHTKAGILTVDTQLVGQFATGPLDHTLLMGVDYKNYRHEAATSYTGNVGNLNVLNPVYGIPFTPVTLNPGDVTNMQQLGIYAQDQIRLDEWILTLNGRYDTANTTIQGAKTTTRDENHFTGRLGLGYEFGNGLTPYVSYATSFNPTLSTDPAGIPYRGETGEQWEAGIKYEPTFMDGLITAAVFNINRNNVVGPDPIPGNLTRQSPVGSVNVKGAELEALANVEDVTIRGALTYLEAQVTRATGTTELGKSPTRIPTLTASLGVDYNFTDNLDGLTVGAGVRFLGDSWADEANTTKVPATALFDVSLRYERDDWSVALSVSNIFDTSYVSGCNGLNSCGYGAGRTATVSLKKTW
jgi:iron complex outermembrane receptor protein